MSYETFQDVGWISCKQSRTFTVMRSIWYGCDLIAEDAYTAELKRSSLCRILSLTGYANTISYLNHSQSHVIHHHVMKIINVCLSDDIFGTTSNWVIFKTLPPSPLVSCTINPDDKPKMLSTKVATISKYMPLSANYLSAGNWWEHVSKLWLFSWEIVTSYIWNVFWRYMHLFTWKETMQLFMGRVEYNTYKIS